MKRLLYIDNLRWVMIMLVVSMHAAVTYSHIGSWYYMEDRIVGGGERAVFGTYQAFLQSFFMGFLFFIAGYFVPGAYDSKGPGRFLRDRLFRLGLPLLLFVFLLQPFSIWCISLFGGEDVGGGLGDVYMHYITRMRWMGGTGPLWFCEALLIFCIFYALVRVLRRRRALAAPGLPGQGPKGRSLPGQELEARSLSAPGLPGRAVVWVFIMLIALSTFIVRLFWPNGTSFYNLQFCYFPQYVFFFIAGTLAYRGDWLSRLSVSTGRYWGWVGIAGGLVWFYTILALGGAFRGQFAPYQGGWHWQSIAMSCWEQLAGVGISIALLVWFRERFDRQGAAARWLSASAFAVYVFHTPVLITLSRLISGIKWPLLLMFVVATMLGIVVTYLISAFVMRRIPGLKRIL